MPYVFRLMQEAATVFTPTPARQVSSKKRSDTRRNEPHHAAPLDEFAGNKLRRLPVPQQHGDAIVAFAELADLF